MAAEGMSPAQPLRLAASAVEIAFAGPGDPRGLAGVGIDANVVPEVGRRKRLLIADMDSTIIGVECIDELADFAGVKPQVAAITEAAMRGALDFEASLEARVALLAGLPEAVLQACYDARVRLN
ncbi:MAG: phosphoserine phosphatase SerB, partial [Rhodobacteraceae bacterium]|nr:phosphoserine phosphatase SerB [Paracoccaceae bacterium]